VRAMEVMDSCSLVAELAGDLSVDLPSDESGAEIKGDELSGGEGLGFAESASGSIVWALKLDRGRIAGAHVSPPSLFGFQAYAESVVGNIFTDVPFAIESFGLSFADAGR